MCTKLHCGMSATVLATVLSLLLSLFPPALHAAPTAQTSIVQCTQLECEVPQCSNPLTLNGECCPVCLEPDLEAGGPQSCVYQGVHFAHEEIFHPPSMVKAYVEAGSTGELDELDNPFCTECTCQDGTTECESIADQCPTLECDDSEAVLIDGACCKICPRTPQQPGPGCLDIDGQTWRLQGEPWHPVYPGYGTIECLTCICQGEHPMCEKDPCPEVPVCGPDDPVEDIVLCCPKCSRGPTTPPAPTGNSTTTPDIAPSLTPSGSEIDLSPSITPCNTSYTIRIYIHSQLDSLALEDTQEYRVETFEWGHNEDEELVRENHQFTSLEFTELEDYSSYTAVGWTIPRRVAGLSMKESKRLKIAACTEHCSIMVVNMLRPEISPRCD